jgi:uncharacterized metal-binding protein YceD (DUF177 family)
MTVAPEFSVPVRLDTIGDAPRTITIEADVDQRAALARRFGLIELDRLSATVALTRTGDTVELAGTIRAEAVQPCVASGEPVPAHVDQPFALRFVPEAAATGDEDEVELDEDDLDTLTHSGGAIDLGEAAAQTLALALDPFPRAAGATDALRAAGVVDEEQMSPFAALKALKDPSSNA